MAAPAGKMQLATFPVHLDSQGKIRKLPQFTGDPAWYERYTSKVLAADPSGRLVSMFTFEKSWDSWEVHPDGEELVVCTSGSITIHQSRDGVVSSVQLAAGEAIVNEAGVWHTADVSGPTTVLFVTAGRGTQHHPR